MASVHKQPSAMLLPDQITQYRVEASKTSTKRCGIVEAYAANTSRGDDLQVNTARISIVTNIYPPKDKRKQFHINYDRNKSVDSMSNISAIEEAEVSKQAWPRCSMFAIFDGIGGKFSAEYLRDSLHKYIIEDKNFPAKPKQAIFNGIQKAEEDFLRKVYDPTAGEILDESGASILLALTVANTCYVASVGDSRALLTTRSGKSAFQLTRDHNLKDEIERNRLKVNSDKPELGCASKTKKLPGTRCFGLVRSKLADLGGNPHAITPDPDMVSFEVKPEHQQLVLLSRGIFDSLDNTQVLECMTKVRTQFSDGRPVHGLVGL